MVCYHPIAAWQSRAPKANGKKLIIFGAPAPARVNEFEPINLPCGQCVGCRLDRSKQWAIRCVHEAKYHAANSFLTLTYDNSHVPWSSITGEQTLCKRDLQLFFKRLRKAIYPTKVRYFACGEYGDTTNRPHYHVILFGYDFSDSRFVHQVTPSGILWRSDKLNEIWGNGHCVIANVTFDTCAYTARYILKKTTGEAAEERYEGIEPEYTVMSRRPGIAYQWFEDYKNDVYPYDRVVLIDDEKARVCRPPKYYDRLYDLECPDVMADIKARRIEKAKSKEAELYDANRMLAKEQFKLQQIKKLKRSVD